MITPIVPQIFKVTVSVNPYANVNVSTPIKNHRQTFFILADSGKMAQAKARLYMRENNVQCVTFCDGIEQPYRRATEALAFAKESGALNDARRLRDFIQRRNAQPQNATLKAAKENTLDPVSIEFTKRYQTLAASLGV